MIVPFFHVEAIARLAGNCFKNEIYFRGSKCPDFPIIHNSFRKQHLLQFFFPLNIKGTPYDIEFRSKCQYILQAFRKVRNPNRAFIQLFDDLGFFGCVTSLEFSVDFFSHPVQQVIFFRHFDLLIYLGQLCFQEFFVVDTVPGAFMIIVLQLILKCWNKVFFYRQTIQDILEQFVHLSGIAVTFTASFPAFVIVEVQYLRLGLFAAHVAREWLMAGTAYRKNFQREFLVFLFMRHPEIGRLFVDRVDL